VAEAIAALPGAEVHAVEGSKIVIVLEGRESGEIGARLAQIALMDGVLAANLVYEHVERLVGDEDVALTT
jgi:nitrate reductase NapD